MTWLLIVNPVAGGGIASRILPELRSRLRMMDIEAKVWISTYHLHAVKLAEEAVLQGHRQIISVGGDGTLHEVAGAIMRSEKGAEVVLGVIPIGAGNDFCRSLGIGNDLSGNLEIIRQGKVRRLDIGKMEDTYFVNSMGAGFDAVVAQRAEKVRFFPGRLRYLYAVLSSLLRSRYYPVRIETDGEIQDLKALMISIGNGSYCGRGFKLCPLAKLDDGYLDICIVKAIPFFRILLSLPSVFKGTHLQHRFVTYLRSKQILLSSGHDLPLYCDGELPELKDKRRIAISIIHQKLNMLCP